MSTVMKVVTLRRRPAGGSAEPPRAAWVDDRRGQADELRVVLREDEDPAVLSGYRGDEQSAS